MNQKVDRYINDDGYVGVLYAPRGMGWSTCNEDVYNEFLVFDKTLVSYILDRNIDEARNYILSKLPKEKICISSLESIRVYWVIQRDNFVIKVEDNGCEYIRVMGNNMFKA